MGLLSGCTSSPTSKISPWDPTITKAHPTATQAPILPTTPMRQEPTSTFEPYFLPLSDYGPFFIGKRYFDTEDTSRNNRQVRLSVWYPAIKPHDFDGTSLENAEPDQINAPYPLILSSAKVAGIFAPHLASHGFVIVGIRDIDTWEIWDQEMIDQPLDILFALDQISTKPLEGLDGLIDVNRAGAMGYSFDGYNSLALSGARIDPEFFLSRCGNSELIEESFRSFSRRLQCPLIDQWDDFVDNAGLTITNNNIGLWQPMTDERIRAVMPMATEGWLLFGEKGLAAVDKPVLIIVGGNDVYFEENLLIYEHLSSPDKFIITFVGQSHMMIYNREQTAHMKHFAAAFFGYFLQGREDYTAYFSEQFIRDYPALVWAGNN
jgi:predicted dienelactone hydrolase